ncbi:S-adenosyl-L-methionine-dependent methyltransferase [Laetiporus sulphureus 93-53]|uniref:rRNA adenine N(6)-methyltransferase n=1 Tax=Laetiporus sulphureus 93-53 TaxID=1314785 RepID=A0A165BE25_9APHY|nr:S-adenosyl-L-methionine-dependent methyltransferase [Laetiporus sulphureus 93-53]KZT00848.1 S-adenosyl-L-methionine-dependent methyltransferase [Laetiporus sulphureus 93-53]
MWPSCLCKELVQPLRWTCRHSYSTSSSIPPLPPLPEWRTLFNSSNQLKDHDRVSLKNQDTARAVVQSFMSAKNEAAGKGKIIIEAFPGPGAISRALLELPKSEIHKLIILEDHPEYLKYLMPLQEADPRVKVVPLSGFDWDTYSHIEDAGLLQDVEAVPWEGGHHPQLHFISQLQATVKGEQLIAQLFRCIPDRSWLFKYGRIPMSFVLSEWVWKRISAEESNVQRCKLSVIAKATATCKLTMNPEALTPYNDHFHPEVAIAKTAARETRKPGYPLVAMNIIPHAKQIIASGMLEKWDYCLRRLFVLKSTPLKKAINSLAPGAATLLKVLQDPSLPPEEQVDINKAPRDLSLADWALIVRAFDNWPFAPQDLMITDAFKKQNVTRMVL